MPKKLSRSAKVSGYRGRHDHSAQQCVAQEVDARSVFGLEPVEVELEGVAVTVPSGMKETLQKDVSRRQCVIHALFALMSKHMI